MGLEIASSFILWREPELLEGENSLKKLPNLFTQCKIESILILSNKGIVSVGFNRRISI